jgi:hypothetical protein
MTTLIEQLNSVRLLHRTLTMSAYRSQQGDERQFDHHLYNAGIVLEAARRRLYERALIQRKLEERLESVEKTFEKEKTAMSNQLLTLKLELVAERQKTKAALESELEGDMGEAMGGKLGEGLGEKLEGGLGENAPEQSDVGHDVKHSKDPLGQRRRKRARLLRVDSSVR